VTVSFDLEEKKAIIDGREVSIDSDEAFAALARLWTVVGWWKKYSYQYTWLGRPMIQLPEDVLRIQELIWQLKPDVLIETGVAHGGSLVFYASLFEAIGRGKVIGVDIEIRPHNRAAIESHDMAKRITLIEGSSTDIGILEKVKSHIKPGDKVLVILDSDHSKGHVLAELRAYAPLVTPESYIVATDGIMSEVAGGPRAPEHWRGDNPSAAARDFVNENPAFTLAPLAPVFNESETRVEPTYWPGAYLKRK